MIDMKFTWDPKKAKSNLQKHGVSFEEAESVLLHSDTLVVFDGENSHEGEDRFRSIGISELLNVLVVIHCERDGHEYRIISARKAEKNEVKTWQERK